MILGFFPLISLEFSDKLYIRAWVWLLSLLEETASNLSLSQRSGKCSDLDPGGFSGVGSCSLNSFFLLFHMQIKLQPSDLIQSSH